MSLILEALRRSEAQRRLGAPPDLHGTLAASTAARPELGRWIAPMLIAGLVLAMLVLMLFYGQRPLPPAPAPPPAAAPLAPSAAGSPDHAALPAASAGALARELDAPLSPPSPPAAAASSARPEATPVMTAPVPLPPLAAPQPVPQVELAPQPADPAVTAALPLDRLDAVTAALPLDRLDAGSRAQLPPLRVSMHVYDPDPARRFVLIDGRRLREGDLLAADLRLVAIEREGLLFDWRGRSLHLPR